MTTAIERLDNQVAEARKQLDRATAKRDDTINALMRAVAKIKESQRALGRLEKRRIEARAAARAERRAATQGPQGDSIPSLTA